MKRIQGKIENKFFIFIYSMVPFNDSWSKISYLNLRETLYFNKSGLAKASGCKDNGQRTSTEIMFAWRSEALRKTLKNSVKWKGFVKTLLRHGYNLVLILYKRSKEKLLRITCQDSIRICHDLKGSNWKPSCINCTVVIS